MKSIFLLPFLLLISCKDTPTNIEASTKDVQSESKDIQSESKQMISANELMRSLGGSDFHVVLPDNIDSKSIVGLAFKHPDGTIDNFEGNTPFKPGEKVRVIVFRPGADKPKYSIVSDGGTRSGTLPSKFEHTSWLSNKPLYQTGESLMNGTITGGDEVRSDDVDLILYVEPKMDNKSK